MKFLTLLDKIIKGNSLTTVSKIYATTQKILEGEALWVFEKQAWVNGFKTIIDYNLAIEGMMTPLSPP